MIIPVLAAVSQATLERGSSLRQASRMASETWSLAYSQISPESCGESPGFSKWGMPSIAPSDTCLFAQRTTVLEAIEEVEKETYQILSGCPSPTLSLVKRKVL
jgi:hypothetical protein